MAAPPSPLHAREASRALGVQPGPRPAPLPRRQNALIGTPRTGGNGPATGTPPAWVEPARVNRALPTSDSPSHSW